MQGSDDLVIAVVDDDVSPTQPDLAGRLLPTIDLYDGNRSAPQVELGTG